MKSVLILAAILAALNVQAQRRVRLLDEAMVNGDQVTVSDLLPASASPEMRRSAMQIRVGRAPEPGSVRIFTAEQIMRVSGESADFEVPAKIAVRRAGWPLDLASIENVLKNARFEDHLDFSRAQIFAPAVATRKPLPELELLRFRDSGNSGQLFADLRCRERSACGEFEITISFPAGMMRNPPSERGAHSSVRGREETVKRSIPFLVQSGKTAVMTLNEGGLRITEPVIILKRGRMGEFVRASDPTTHRYFLVEVTGNGVVRPVSSKDSYDQRAQ